MNKAEVFSRDWMTMLEKLPWQTLWTRSPFWISLVLVVLIGKAAAEMSWLFLTPETKSYTAVSGKRAAVSNPSSQIRLNRVASLHLFGEAGKEQTTVTDAPIDAPKTTLKLTLRGIFSHSDQDKAMAIIADASGKEKLYRVGARVPGGANIHKIYPDRVILMRNGQLETLELPRDGLPGGAIAIQHRPVDESARTQRTVQAPDKLKEMKNLIKTNPQELWKQVRIEPVLEDGKIKGYRLFHKDPQLMQALGITKTDVVTEINGMSLDDPASLYELMGQLDTMMDIRLTVERNGNTEVLVVHM